MPEYLGQHFLKNKEKLQKIVDALELKNNDIVIEIGPGHGELTEELRIKNYELGIRIIAIEKDGELADKLKEKFSQDKNIEIIQGDALKEIKNQSASWRTKIKITNQNSKIINNLKIIGNIPYYITGYLFRILGDLELKPSLIVLLIQKEVAERVCVHSPKMNPPHKSARGMNPPHKSARGMNPPHKSARGMNPPHKFMWGMNLLAASVQIWAEPKIIDYVSRKDFLPQPKVDSAIIKLEIINNQCLFSHSQECWNEQNKQNVDDYYRFIKILFKQPRKTIVNNLLSGIMNNELRIMNKQEIVEKLAEVGVEPNARPQDLNIEQIKELSK